MLRADGVIAMSDVTEAERQLKLNAHRTANVLYAHMVRVDRPFGCMSLPFVFLRQAAGRCLSLPSYSVLRLQGPVAHGKQLTSRPCCDSSTT